MNSDKDEDAYLLLKEEARKAGKSVRQILAERNAEKKGITDFVYREPKVTDKMTDEVKKTLAENKFIPRAKKDN